MIPTTSYSMLCHRAGLRARAGHSPVSSIGLVSSIKVFRVGHLYLKSAKRVRAECSCLHGRFYISSSIRPHFLPDRRPESLDKEAFQLGLAIHLSTAEHLFLERIEVESGGYTWDVVKEWIWESASARSSTVAYFARDELSILRKQTAGHPSWSSLTILTISVTTSRKGQHLMAFS